MKCKWCTTLAKWLFSAVVSLGMFTAIMAFHLISFVTLLLLAIGIVFGISLTLTYFSKADLPVCVENILILLILSLLSKFHVIFYYKLIYPGDNYERACWGFLKVVTKIIYAALACLSFTKIFQVYNAKCQDGPMQEDILEGVDIGPAKILMIMWHNGNKFFLVSMATLVHLFSVCTYKDYTKLCHYVPFCSWRCLWVIGSTLIGQGFSFFLSLIGYYLAHAWIPTSWKSGDNELLYIGLTQVSLVSWVLQATVIELLIEKAFSIPEKDQAPYYWLQNTNRGRFLLLKLVLIPLSVHLFYSDCAEDWLNSLFHWDGPFVPAGTSKEGIFFTSFFCSVVLHASKSLMLLKNGIGRIIYTFWMCYFRLQELLLCCCDEDDWLTETSSGTAVVSELTEDEPKNSASGTSHGYRKWRFWPESKRRAREHFAEGAGNESESVENVVKVNNALVPALRNGVGDTGWGSPMVEATADSKSVGLDMEISGNMEQQVYQTQSMPLQICDRREEAVCSSVTCN